MIDKIKPYLRSTLITGLAYGLGLMLGNIISALLFNSVNAEGFLSGNQAVHLVQGIFLAFFIAGLGGFVGGGIGGYTLPLLGHNKTRRGYVLRSGFTFGIGYGLLVFPLILIIALLSYYDVSETPFYVFSIVFGGVGLLFGIIMGLSLGLWTVKRRFPPITRFTAAGFALGGMLLGYDLWRYIFAVTEGDVRGGPVTWLVFGLFLFAGLGGLGLGFAYNRLADNFDKTYSPVRNLTRRSWRRRWSIIAVILLLLVLLIRPVLAAVGDLLTPVDAQLQAVIDLPTAGTHWFEPTAISDFSNTTTPTIATGTNGRIALAWIEDNTLLLQEGYWSAADQKSEWQTPVVVDEGADLSAPVVVVDDNGRTHLAWVDSDFITYTNCADGSCSSPIVIEKTECEQGAGTGNAMPTMALHGDELLLVWTNNAGLLPYAAWPVAGSAPQSAAGCVPVAAAAEPQLAEDFTLIFRGANDVIQTVKYVDGLWSDTAVVLGNGRLPNMTTDNSGQNHAVWCGENEIIYWTAGQTETVAAAPCLSRPAVAVDDIGQVHVLWYANAVEKSTGVVQPASLIYESLKDYTTWTRAAIVGTGAADSQPDLTAAQDGSLHSAWSAPDQLSYAAQIQYSCDPDGLSSYGQVLYDIAREEKYMPAEDIVPYCQNQYDRLLITPNPDPAYSDAPMPPNGVYDKMGDMIRAAQYEVLFSTMWYDKAANHDSPGSVIAAAVADLYNNLKAHPEQYPRGITVRIMLGNPPELATGEPTGQLWTLIDDLRYAGIDKMVDEEIGWRLQVADFEGSMPHSHVKTIVIDGKTATANGFNMTYDHFPADHISGEGGGRFDVGLQVTGPAAQATQRMFDDMWNGADQRNCINLDPPLGIPWQATCYDISATVDHVPEVQKFYLPGGSSTVFSMYRSKVHDQADRQVVAVLAAAQESIDAMHVNFTLEMVCDLNVLFDICTVDVSPDYMSSLLQAAQNGAHVRVLMKPGPTEGIENIVALDALEKRLVQLGIADKVEVRYFEGSVHPKAALVDDQLLIIGSQNFHYSAFGRGGGLTEYSMAIEDEAAIADYKAAFEYQWEHAEESN